jgi:hypothetical protein
MGTLQEPSSQQCGLRTTPTIAMWAATGTAIRFVHA